MSNARLDPVDERILRLLERNARTSWRDVGATVGLSANAVAVRVRRLEQAGVIRGWTLLLGPGAHDERSSALVLLRIATDVRNEDIETRILGLTEVVEVLDVAGPWDYQVRVRHATTAELYTSVNRLRDLPGVTAIETRAVLREVLAR